MSADPRADKDWVVVLSNGANLHIIAKSAAQAIRLAATADTDVVSVKLKDMK